MQTRKRVSRRGGEEGVALVEATIGIVILLLVTLLVIQTVLVFHAALAAHSAATRTARAVALGGDPSLAGPVYEVQKSSNLTSLDWWPVQCQLYTHIARCTVTVEVPSLLPGAGHIFGGGWSGVFITETGQYPVIDLGG